MRTAVSLRLNNIRWAVPPVSCLGGVFAVDEIVIAEICARLTLVKGCAEPRGLAITILQPTLLLSCGGAPVSQHDPCTCSQIQRFRASLGDLRLHVALARVRQLLPRIFYRVTVVVEGVTVHLACHAQAARSGTPAQVLALTVEKIALPMPEDSSSQLQPQPGAQKSGIKQSREINTRNICVACCVGSNRFSLLSRWGFTVRLEHIGGCQGHAKCPSCIEITFDAKAMALTVEEAAAPSMSAAISCVKEQLAFSAIRAHRPRRAVRESVVCWWQYALKGVLHQLHSYNGAASVTCLRQLPAYVQAAKRCTHWTSACLSGVFAVPVRYSLMPATEQPHLVKAGDLNPPGIVKPHATLNVQDRAYSTAV
jgi:Vacuolar sorting-associated protein 13, N-terminal